MISPCSLSPVRSPSSISANDRLGTAGDVMVPYRRPSGGPPTTSSSTAAKAISTILARSSSSRRRHRRHSCTQWRANTYNGTNDYCGSVEFIDNDDGRSSESGAKLSSTPATTILCLREAMRSLAYPQMQLCIGGSGAGRGAGALSAPASNSVSTLSVAIIGGTCGYGSQQEQQRRRSSGGASVKHSSMSPPSRNMSPKHQPVITLLTADDCGGALGATTTRSASVCYPPNAQQMSRRTSTMTKSGRLERSNSLISGRGGAMLAFMPDLNPQQVANLRRTWKHINTKGLYDIIRRSFRKVESAHSSVAKAFRQNSAGAGNGSSSNIAAAHAENCAAAGGTSGKVPLPPQTKFCGVMEHSKYFMVLLNRIIDGDNNQEELVRELKQIGAQHVIVYKRFGVGVTEIERSGEALAESLFKLDGIRQSKEATKVWRVLIAKIIDHIVTGFTGELRSQRRRTSSALLSSAAGALAAPLFEDKFVKRNSVPNPYKTFVRSATASNEEYDDDQGLPSSTVSPSHSVATTSLLSANYIHQSQQSSPNSDCFLRAELAGVVRRLSNL